MNQPKDLQNNKQFSIFNHCFDVKIAKNEKDSYHSFCNPAEATKSQSNIKMLDGVTEGYDVQLKKETAQAWEFVCTKSKTNTKKNDPKKMNLVISKTTYLPISVSVSEKGVRITMRDFAIGVNEEVIRFDPSKYQNAKIVDKR